MTPRIAARTLPKSGWRECGRFLWSWLLVLGLCGGVPYGRPANAQSTGKAAFDATGDEISRDDAGKEFYFNANSRLVVLDVAVHDSHGRNVAGLKREHFRVYEDGKLKPIAQFGADDEPVSVGFVIDTSMSMLEKHAEVVTAVTKLTGASNPADQLFAVVFNDRPFVALPGGLRWAKDSANAPYNAFAGAFTSDGDALQTVLSHARVEGRTALYDGVAAALKLLEKAKWEKRALVVVSDGGDNSSNTTMGAVSAKIRETRTLVYTIGLFGSSDADRNPGVLRKLAELSGANPYFPKTGDTLNEACSAIAQDIRARYTIAFAPTPESKKEVRKLRVTLTSDAGQKLHVRTREEYVFRDGRLAAERSDDPKNVANARKLANEKVVQWSSPDGLRK